MLTTSGNSKTLPVRKFAQFNNNFEQLEKQQKQLEKLQRQQQQQQYNHQHHSTANLKHEFLNPFPCYRNFPTTSALTKHHFNLNNYGIFQQQQQHHNQHQQQQLLYMQNSNVKSRGVNNLETSLINKNPASYITNEPLFSNTNKKNSEFKSNNNINNKRRSTQVFNL